MKVFEEEEKTFMLNQAFLKFAIYELYINNGCLGCEAVALRKWENCLWNN